MPLIRTPIPNWYGGVSQQPESLRLNNQVEAQHNMWASPADGLKQRRPTEHVVKAIDGDVDVSENVLLHVIARDAQEKYLAVIRQDEILVFGEDGTQYPVHDPVTPFVPDFSYLDTGPFRALTIADTTIILNTTKVTAMDAALSPDDPTKPVGGDHAMVFVRSSSPFQTYKVRLRLQAGTGLTASFKTDEDSYDTNEDIAESLETQLDTISGVTATRQGSVIDLVCNAEIRKLFVTDGRGDESMIRIWQTVRNFTDLPQVAAEGFLVKIVGNPEGGTVDDYYVKFVGDNDTGDAQSTETGVWTETLAPNIEYAFDATTMPHKLTRRQDDGLGTVTGTPDQIYFEWTVIDWDDRLVGDEATNEQPSFMSTVDEDRTIQDLFFFQGRLGFLSGPNLILSESNLFFNFWRTTITSVPDSDPIDVALSHTKVVQLHDAVPSDERLIVFSGQTQFLVDSSTGLITPSTISSQPALDYENLFGVEAVTVGRSVFFPYGNGEFSGIRDMFQATEISFDAEDISAHARRYIEGSLTQLAACNLENVVVGRADGDLNKLWVYQLFYSGNQRIQSAWSTYDFGPGAEVRSVGWLEHKLYLLVQQTEGLFLYRMSVGSGVVDEDSSYTVHLDRRVRDDTTGVTAVYSAGPDTTVITLPYDLEAGADMQVVTRQSLSGVVEGGHVLTPVSTGSNTVTVNGDLSADLFYVGQGYESFITIAKPVLREAGPNGGQVRVGQPRWQLRALEVFFEDTAGLRATINAASRTATTKEFSSPVAGSVVTVLGALTLSDGKLRIPVQSRADQLTVTLSAPGPLPLNLINGEWEGQLRGRAARFGA